jgi:hypothetical protein
MIALAKKKQIQRTAVALWKSRWQIEGNRLIFPCAAIHITVKSN